MSFLTDLLHQMAERGHAARAASAPRGLSQLARDAVPALLAAMTPADQRRAFDELAATPPRVVRELQAGIPGRVSIGNPSTQEEVGAILLNLCRAARRAATHPAAPSFLSPADQLLQDLIPRCRAGSPVPGADGWHFARFLGTGSLGEVWTAAHAGALQLPRVFKIFTRPGAADFLRRDAAELDRITRALSSDGTALAIVGIQLGDPPTPPALELEYAPGGSLEDWIVEHSDHRPALPKRELLASLVASLARAHRRGLFHRNLKPSNILLAADAQPKIGDWGLSPAARWAGTDGGRDDVLTLGLIAYHLLAERLAPPPYDVAEELRRLDVAPALVRVVCRCLAPADRRYADATELEREWEQSLSGPALPEWPPVPPGCFDVSLLLREFLRRE